MSQDRHCRVEELFPTVRKQPPLLLSGCLANQQRFDVGLPMQTLTSSASYALSCSSSLEIVLHPGLCVGLVWVAAVSLAQ